MPTGAVARKGGVGGAVARGRGGPGTSTSELAALRPAAEGWGWRLAGMVGSGEGAWQLWPRGGVAAGACGCRAPVRSSNGGVWAGASCPGGKGGAVARGRGGPGTSTSDNKAARCERLGMEARRERLGAETGLGTFGPVEEQPLGPAVAAGSAMPAASGTAPEDGWRGPQLPLAVGGSSSARGACRRASETGRFGKEGLGMLPPMGPAIATGGGHGRMPRRGGGAGGRVWLLPHLRGRVLARCTRAFFEWGGAVAMRQVWAGASCPATSPEDAEALLPTGAVAAAVP